LKQKQVNPVLTPSDVLTARVNTLPMILNALSGNTASTASGIQKKHKKLERSALTQSTLLEAIINYD